MDQSTFFEQPDATKQFGNEDFEKDLRLWNKQKVPAIRYFAGIRYIRPLVPEVLLLF